MTAVRNNDLDAVQRHIVAGADVNTSSPGADFEIVGF
jgi:hypothetical protein